jgi:hypothetical protein
MAVNDVADTSGGHDMRYWRSEQTACGFSDGEDPMEDASDGQAERDGGAGDGG